MKRFFLAVGAFSFVSGGCADLASLGTPAALENVGALLAVASFQRHGLSGVEPDNIKFTITSEFQLSAENKSLAIDDPQLKAIFDDQCTLKHSAASPAALPFAPIVIAWGQWIYGKLTSLVDTRIQEFKSASNPPAYKAKAEPASNLVPDRAKGTVPFANTKCFLFQRGAKAKSGELMAHGLTVLVRRDGVALDDQLSKYKLLYARLDNAVAVTGTAADGSAEAVSVGISMVVQSARRTANRPAVFDLTNVVFTPIALTFDAHGHGTARGCAVVEKKSKLIPVDKKCTWETDYLANPAPNSRFYVAEFSVGETGSGASAADKAAASFKALNESTLQKAYTTWLTGAVQRSGF